MDSAFRCEDGGRRRRLLEQSAPPGSRIDAIDFLVVADGPGVPDSLRQRVLLVRTVFGDHMAALDASVVAIEGGVRVREFAIRWAMAMPDLVLPGGPANDASIEPDATARAWLTARVAATPDAAQWFVVRVEEPGDHSLYTFRLQSGAGTPVPGFDRRLSAVDFSFKVECPTKDDCGATAECGPTWLPSVEIDYLARDFPSFRRLMFDRLALLQPGEDDREAAHLRTTLVELLAWAADRLAHQQDAVATEAYLGTARLRRSVRRHARLLDYPMHDGCNARAFVHVRMRPGESAGAPGAPALPVGARFWSRVPELVAGPTLAPLPWIDAERVRALAERPIAFETMIEVERLTHGHDDIAIHTWDDADCCLRAGTTTLTLQNPAGELELRAGDLLLLEEIAWTPPAITEDRRDPDTSHRHVVRLASVSAPYTDELVGIDVIDVAWHEHDALPFDMPVANPDGRTTVARGNMVLVDQGGHEVDLAVVVEPFGRGGRVARLESPRLTWREPLPDAALAPARVLAMQDPRRALPQVRLVEADDTVWLPQRDLVRSAGSARDFVVEMESTGRAHLRFGDDRLGRAPAVGSAFARAEYRVGNGDEGNVGAESIVHAVADPDRPDAFPLVTALAIESLRNPLPGTGGTAPEPIDDVRLYAPHAFRRQERAVTTADWAEVAQRDPEIQRAVAKIEWTGSWSTVFLHIDRREGRPVDDEFRAQQLARLSRYRLAGYDLEIVAPRFVPVDLAATVCVAPGFLRDDVERRIRREFTDAMLPDGRRGFFHPDEFTFGQPLHLSRVVARMMTVAGVRDVDFTPPTTPLDPPRRFKRWGRPQGDEVDKGRIAVGPLEIIRCDNDPNYPDNGRIEFFTGGGL